MQRKRQLLKRKMCHPQKAERRWTRPSHKVPDRHSLNTAAAMHQTPREPTGSRTGRQQPRRQLEPKGKAGPAKREVVSPKNQRTRPLETRKSSRPRFVPFWKEKPPGLTTRPPDDRWSPKEMGRPNASHQQTEAEQGRKARQKPSSASSQIHEPPRMANKTTSTHTDTKTGMHL